MESCNGEREGGQGGRSGGWKDWIRAWFKWSILDFLNEGKIVLRHRVYEL